jgi:thiol-disulfide isomerase/thioredoxin
MISALMTTDRGMARQSGILAACALALAAFTAARADELVCKPNYDYSVEVDGSYPKNATLYQAANPGLYYVEVPACKTGLLMDLKARKVVAVPRDQVKQVDGTVQLSDSVPPSAAAYALAVEGPVVQFQADDKKVRIVRCLDRPPIVGAVEMGALIADRPEYREGMKGYAPQADSITTMNKYAKKVQIDAFFATWCPHCKEYMPKFLRVVSELKNPNIKVNLYGVPKGFTQTPGPWQGRNINSIPTIIVKIDGKEITRMGSQPGAVPETELAGIFDAVR